MSRQQNNKPTARDVKKQFVRLISLILAILMVAGMAYSAIYLLITPASAAENDRAVLNTSSLKADESVKVSVGLSYGSNITTGFQVSTDIGYVVGMQDLKNDRNFTPIWDLYETNITCTSDNNLTKRDMTYSVTNEYYATLIGAYHIEIHCDHLNREQFTSLLYDNAKLQQVWSLGLYAIPSYIYTGYSIRIGDFASYEQANGYYQAVASIYSDYTVMITEPSANTVSVVNPYTDKIVFEFACAGSIELGLQAMPNSAGNTYITTPAGNYYDGVFCFKR